MDDDDDETADYQTAADQLWRLMDRWRKNDLCACCCARALLIHGADLSVHAIGAQAAAGILRELLDGIDQDSASHSAH